MANDHIYEDRAEQERIKKRAELKAKLRREYMKKATDPHRPIGGVLFDPAVQRFMSMNATVYDQFKPTVKNSFLYFGILGAMAGYAYLLYRDRETLDQKCRRGEIPYKDRVTFK
ncbi:NADH dehydrogenase [ubiquinone] 1 beta subcomplex subunit 4 [Centruroides vittatus]|uniref:uncharacterized protein LOC111628400 n=1 Tax=Centruroides sculpturatus TaxID=218467 RepID=UPI000C6DEEE2|nr:uncharacterized protein LOC111628400 [Centruroides sculpturatus]